MFKNLFFLLFCFIFFSCANEVLKDLEEAEALLDKGPGAGLIANSEKANALLESRINTTTGEASDEVKAEGDVIWGQYLSIYAEALLGSRGISLIEDLANFLGSSENAGNSTIYEYFGSEILKQEKEGGTLGNDAITEFKFASTAMNTYLPTLKNTAITSLQNKIATLDGLISFYVFNTILNVISVDASGNFDPTKLTDEQALDIVANMDNLIDQVGTVAGFDATVLDTISTDIVTMGDDPDAIRDFLDTAL
jgi:hypothetical protein